ncbi:PREDICTED: uncharacterized protein LOC109465523 [Branchiostoma belcheri]|uniref:Threonylcarbamoyl-AMP synthase n=1 Tax=Branchiostoma belcheri TaxID=7741 RepID=A0A6P4Y7Z6_BRABE|nr:PREDICTED: uncharacterized protein LOC109465523 [Branchiostoma belcheri]
MPTRNKDKVVTLPVGPRVQGMTGVVLGSLVLAAHNFSLDLTVASPNSLVTGAVLVITGLMQFSAGVRLLRRRCHTLTTLYLCLSVLWGSLGSAKILEGLDILSLNARNRVSLPGMRKERQDAGEGDNEVVKNDILAFGCSLQPLLCHSGPFPSNYRPEQYLSRYRQYFVAVDLTLLHFCFDAELCFPENSCSCGRSLLPEESLRGVFARCRCARHGYESLPSSPTTTPSASSDILGYSKYASADTLGFLSNAVTALAVALLSTGDKSLVLPWVIVPGGVIQFVAGTISFSRGKTFESTAFLVYSMMWLLCGSVRYSGVYRGSEGLGVAAGAASFLLFNLFVIFLSVVINKAWLVLSVVFEVVCVLFLLDSLGVQTSQYFELAVMCVFGAVCVYCFCVHLLNGMCGDEVMSLGSPLLTLGRGRRDRGGEQGCVIADARKANGVKQIAELLKDGGICGMPTDTVYVLVAACNRPAAVERAYRTKKQAEERPMSIWISQLSQLEPARQEFGPLLWDFMKEVWPSSISLVIKRGPWLDRFGLGDSARYIGTPESIAIRIPDCTVATHLIDLVGPIAVTSANPSGEADTTHHSQVTAKLGDNVDGVLCDGPSPENIASTVVNCTKIDEGDLGFFRVGIVPKATVLGIFESVRRRHSGSGSAGGRNDSAARRRHDGSSTNMARTRVNVDVVRGVASDLAGIVVHQAQDDDSDIGGLPHVAVIGGADTTANSLAFSTTNLLDLKS